MILYFSFIPSLYTQKQTQIPGELKQWNNREDPTLFVQVFKQLVLLWISHEDDVIELCNFNGFAPKYNDKNKTQIRHKIRRKSIGLNAYFKVYSLIYRNVSKVTQKIATNRKPNEQKQFKLNLFMTSAPRLLSLQRAKLESCVSLRFCH